MALSVSKDHANEELMGRKRVLFFDLTFTGVTGGEVKTGLANVVFAQYSPNKTDDHGVAYRNFSDAGSTAAAGSVYVDGVTSGDTGRLMVIGY